MDPKDCFEAEILFIIPNIDLFTKLLNLNTAADLRTQKKSSFLQASIFMDTLNLDILNSHSALAFQLLPNEDELYISFKTDYFSLPFNKMLVRREFGEVTNVNNPKISKKINEKINFFCENKISFDDLTPKLLIKQERHQKIILDTYPTIHLSFDKVFCRLPGIPNKEYSFLSIEIEVTNTETHKLQNPLINTLVEHFIRQGCKKVHPSKYAYGMDLVNVMFNVE